MSSVAPPLAHGGSRRLWRSLAVALVAILSGCSENFGPPPPDANRRLPVGAESFAGPVPARTLLALGETAGSWLLGTDAGIYRWRTPWVSPRCVPEYGGFSGAMGSDAVSSIGDLAAAGQIVAVRTRLGTTDFLSVSGDGGRSYAGLSLPVPSQQSVDALYAWAASPRDASGRVAVAQGPSLYTRATTANDWMQVEFDLSPQVYGPAGLGPDGRIWLAVRLASDWAVVRSDDGGARFVDTGLRETEPILFLAHDGTRLHRVTSTRWTAGDESFAWAGRRILAAGLAVEDGALRFGMLGEAIGGGQPYLGRGTGLPSSIDEVALSFTPVVDAFLVDMQGVVVGAGDATLVRFQGMASSPLAFAGGELDWGAMARVPQMGELVLAQARSGEVFRGDAQDPQSMRSLGSPLFQSQPRALHVEPGSSSGIFLGSFGAHYLPAGSVVWETRDTGQFSYLLENFSGPVKPQVIAESPLGVLWLGAIQGDGPYRSVDGGRSWTRVHDGLGLPGSRPGEDGLPDAPQVNAFAFSGAAGGERVTWMGTFRGGVQRLDDGATPFWEQLNRGLLDDDGAPVDSCCVDTERRAVDVRDLVALADGTLLAATAQGAFRLGPARVSWEESSLGLANLDLRAFAVDPNDSRRVVAVGWGNAENEPWLFYSEDAGLSWIAVATSLVAKRAMDVVWSRPERNEVVAILQTQGAWRVELMP